MYCCARARTHALSIHCARACASVKLSYRGKIGINLVGLITAFLIKGLTGCFVRYWGMVGIINEVSVFLVKCAVVTEVNILTFGDLLEF